MKIKLLLAILLGFLSISHAQERLPPDLRAVLEQAPTEIREFLTGHYVRQTFEDGSWLLWAELQSPDGKTKNWFVIGSGKYDHFIKG